MKSPPRLLAVPALWLLALLSLLVLGALYRLGSAADEAEQQREELAVSELLALDIATNLEVIELRLRQKLDYDSLVRLSDRADRLLRQLEPEFARFGLLPPLAAAGEAWRDKAKALERFKRLNALVGTSQYHFVNLSEQLGGEVDSPRLERAARAMLASLTRCDGAGPPEELAAALEKLQAEVDGWPPPARLKGRLLLTHAGVIRENLPAAREAAKQARAGTFAARLREAHQAYGEARQRAAVQTARWHTAMAAFSLLLIAGMLAALFNLRRSAREIERAHQLLDSIAGNLGEGILAFDRGGCIRFANRRAAELLGQPPGALQGLAADALQIAGAAASPLLAAIGRGRPSSGDAWLAGAAGALPIAFTGRPLPAGADEAGAAAYVLSFRDLSEERAAAARLHQAAHVFDSLAEAMLITDAEGVVQFVNPAFTAATGYGEDEARGKKPGTLLASGRHDAEFFAALWTALRSTGLWQGEIINRRKDGNLYMEWLSISAVRDAQGRVLQYIGLFSDLGERKEAETYIHHLAYHDPLTGLANRRLFKDRLETALRQSQRSGRPLSLLLFDLDGFKRINDSLGHAAGDELLGEAARRIAAAVRECDTFARLDGDEFALLTQEIRDADDGTRVAAKLIQLFDAPFRIGGRETFITTSIGIADFPGHGQNGDELLRHAGAALDAAKQAGRNTWFVFDPGQEKGGSDRLELAGALRHALARHELSVHYQLRIEAAQRRISGAQALLRWQHPERGTVPPERFIPVAEQTGLIEEIGAWCLQTACAQLLAWQRAGVAVPRIAVTVSARQLRAAGFADRVMKTIERTGIAPDQLELELELGEGTLSGSSGQIFALFAELRRQGVRIVIDDFGTGYSSLNYLAQSPVDALKIGRGFVSRLDGEQSEASYVVQAIILLAQSMNMETVAAGVETEQQQSQLARLGCTHLQGLRFSRPLPPEAVSAQLVREAEAAA